MMGWIGLYVGCGVMCCVLVCWVLCLDGERLSVGYFGFLFGDMVGWRKYMEEVWRGYREYGGRKKMYEVDIRNME